MPYYNELVNLSPMTVDYDNLTNVMGPGCESKEPYLNSYFSIVTEILLKRHIFLLKNL